MHMKWSLITLIFNFFFSFVIFLAYNSAYISEYSRSVALVNATPSTLNIICPPKYEINCRNIHTIRVIDRGTRRGRLRKVDVGFFKERKVAIKRFNDLKPQQVSYEIRQLFFINEILLLDQLSHRL